MEHFEEMPRKYRSPLIPTMFVILAMICYIAGLFMAPQKWEWAMIAIQSAIFLMLFAIWLED